MKLVHNSNEEKNLCNSLSYVVFLFCFPWVKISVLSNQYIIQVFRLITMLLSCIYAVVYFGSYAFLRGVISGQHDKKGIATLCASF